MFGQQPVAGSGELILGRGAFDGNGFNNETGSSGSAGPSGSSTLDMNEFPSLGGSSGGDNSSFTAALRQQEQLIAQQQMMQGQTGNSNSQQPSNLYRLAMGSSMGTSLGSSTGSSGGNFNMASEDFPALPGAPQSGSVGGGSGGNSSNTLLGGVNVGIEGAQRDISTGASSTGSSFGAPSRSTSNTSNMFGGELDSLANQLESSNLLGSNSGTVNQSSSNSGITSQRRPSSSSTQSSGGVGASSGGGASSSSGPSAGSALSGDYGLLGLLGVIRMSDADRNALALGSDLTTLGLNLNSSDQLYSTFASPWSESPTTREPQYQLPMCYYMQPPALKTGHLSKFQLETLFYIFYALPRDVLQAYASQELYSREWKYHVDLKLWFKRASPSDGVTNSGNGMQYIYFDINSWERRLFNSNMNQNITSGLLSEDDIRVKFPNS